MLNHEGAPPSSLVRLPPLKRVKPAGHFCGEFLLFSGKLSNVAGGWLGLRLAGGGRAAVVDGLMGASVLQGADHCPFCPNSQAKEAQTLGKDGDSEGIRGWDGNLGNLT